MNITERKFTPPHPLNTAVLFMVFNRLETAKKVFAEIKKAKPPRLYIASDGARENREEENKLVEENRKYVLENIDWDCEVKTLFREKNLGCKMAVSGAIDWFFENEEMGIILEDDCVPSQSFFWFCEKMLDRYKNDTRIMMISGTNYVKKEYPSTYFFSKHFTIWGWATWRRAWSKYNINIDDYLDLDKSIYSLSSNYWINKHYEYTFDLVINKNYDTWDIQWVYCGLINNGLCITPYKNLISNIGVDGTHTTGVVTDSHFINKSEIDLNNITHPLYVLPNNNYDNILNKINITSLKYIFYKDLLKKILPNFIIKLIKKTK